MHVLLNDLEIYDDPRQGLEPGYFQTKSRGSKSWARL